MEARSARSGSYLDLSRLTGGELFGMASALLLVGSLFLPWFSTNDANPASVIDGQQGQFNAFETFNTLHWWLIAGATAPFILAWIIARGHKLTWNPGEVTMIVGVTAMVLILLNGIILGKPGDSVEIGFEVGYFVAFVAAAGIGVGGYLRQASYIRSRKPPGTM